MRRTLLVTNDYPPKVGGIQNYLWELVRRLPADDVAVYTTPYRGAEDFDRQQGYAIERSTEPVLLPYPWLAKRICERADAFGAELILLDPAVPLGVIGPMLDRPYGVVLHGAEVTIPGRAPGAAAVLGKVLRNSSVVISAGQYALAEAERCAGGALPAVVVPPGVDTTRFVPLPQEEWAAARDRLGIAADALVVASVSRLVPRKGMHRLVSAAEKLHQRFPELEVIIGGTGRQAGALRRQIDSSGAPVRMLGRLEDADVAALYGASDVMAMLCADRWLGWEQEGFGIVFLEAAAAGVPQVAGASGGAPEAVVNNETGLVVDPCNAVSGAAAIGRLLAQPELRHTMGTAARQRAVTDFDYDILAARLANGLDTWGATS